MKRPLVFALELLVAGLLSVAAAYSAAKIGGKLNGKSNADIRSSFALVRIAEALERKYPAPAPLPRPSMLGPREWNDSEGLLRRDGSYVSAIYDSEPQYEYPASYKNRLAPPQVGLEYKFGGKKFVSTGTAVGAFAPSIRIIETPRPDPDPCGDSMNACADRSAKWADINAPLPRLR